MLNILTALTLTVTPLSAMQQDTPPPLSIPVEQLKSQQDIIAATRMGNWTTPPADLKLPRLVNQTSIATYFRHSYPDSMQSRTDLVMPWTWVFIDEKGVVQSVRLIKSSGNSLADSIALKAVEIARFDPAMANGTPAAVRTPIPVQLPHKRGLACEGEADPNQPCFTPYTLPPELLNRDVVGRALVKEYPPALRDAGIGGTVLLWVLLDVEGRVRKQHIKESSGHMELDRAAVAVAGTMRFRPAKHHNDAVPVWIQLPIVFKSSGR